MSRGWTLLLSVVLAAELEQVRVFVGKDDARVLLVADGPLTGTVRGGDMDPWIDLVGMGIAPELAAAWPERDGVHAMPVDQGGLHRVRFETGRVSFELDDPRKISIEPVGERGLLVDLLALGAEADPSLPGAAILADWLSGVSLKRAGQKMKHKDRFLVVLDPGHGGFDTGAPGVSGSEEADIALGLARRVAWELEDQGVEVAMTRDIDIFIPLEDRALFANTVEADAFVSIHCNAAPGPTAWGITTFDMNTATDEGAARVAARENALVRESHGELDRVVADLEVSGATRMSKALAHSVQSRVIGDLRGIYGQAPIRDLGVQSALFYVLVYARMPAILFESSFVSNPEEELRLRSPAFQQAMAEALAGGIVDFLRTQARPGSPRAPSP